MYFEPETGCVCRPHDQELGPSAPDTEPRPEEVTHGES
jgi:hypothetical protein